MDDYKKIKLSNRNPQLEPSVPEAFVGCGIRNVFVG